MFEVESNNAREPGAGDEITRIEMTMNPPDPHDLARFVTAQAGAYAQALAEIRAGRHRTHWMWFVFPQIHGLGSSKTSRHYAIKGRAEAEAYLAHPVLGPRLREISEALLGLEGKAASEIFGSPDDLKLRCCATLFASVSPPGSVFELVLAKFYGGEPDRKTLRLLRSGVRQVVGRRPDGEPVTIIEYCLRIDERAIVDMYRRHWQPKPGTQFFFWLRVVLASVLAFSSISSAFHGWPGMTLFWAFLIAVLFRSEGQGWWTFRRKLLRLIAFGRVWRVVIAPEGIRCLVGSRQANHSWSDFKGAGMYPDGIELHVTDAFVYWLPDSAIVVGSRCEAEALVRAFIPAGARPDAATC